MIFHLLLCLSWAETIPATKLTGDFQISGFSFGGKISGEVYVGEADQLYFHLVRPAGIPLISLTYTRDEVCVWFDFDNTYYSGSPEDFAELSSGYVPPNTLSNLMLAREQNISGWTWHTKNNKIKRVTIGEPTLAQARYNQWKDGSFSRIQIDVLDSGWKLKGTVKESVQTTWNFQCIVPEGAVELPLQDMRNSIPPKQ